ncbi:hypothetical protein ACQ5SK_44015 [Bradyrhizobium japonicum]
MPRAIEASPKPKNIMSAMAANSASSMARRTIGAILEILVVETRRNGLVREQKQRAKHKGKHGEGQQGAVFRQAFRDPRRGAGGA